MSYEESSSNRLHEIHRHVFQRQCFHRCYFTDNVLIDISWHGLNQICFERERERERILSVIFTNFLYNKLDKFYYLLIKKLVYVLFYVHIKENIISKNVCKNFNKKWKINVIIYRMLVINCRFLWNKNSSFNKNPIFNLQFIHQHPVYWLLHIGILYQAFTSF